jgi:hypothetical protein
MTMIKLLSHSRGPATVKELPGSVFAAQELWQELLASWQNTVPAAERRQGHRRRAAVTVTRVVGPPQEVRVKDVSPRGVAIVHVEPLPYRKVLLTFSNPNGKTTSLVVRLKWCRFKKSGEYESGGQFLRRVPTPPEPPTAA